MAYDNVKEVDCLDVSKEGTEAWDAACKRYLSTVVCVWLILCLTANYAYYVLWPMWP